VSNLYTLATLNLVTVAYLSRAISEEDFLLQAPHVCGMDNIRIPVASSQHSCLMYILPSRNFGFDAVFSRKVLSEHIIIDTDLATLEPLSEGNWTLEACRAC
jgi:hypothetical protein